MSLLSIYCVLQQGQAQALSARSCTKAGQEMPGCLRNLAGQNRQDKVERDHKTSPKVTWSR